MRKKFLTICIMLTLLTILAGCAGVNTPGAGSPGEETTAATESETSTGTSIQVMPISETSGTFLTEEEAEAHSHQLSEGGNVLEHDPVGYCGNTVTKVSYTPFGKTEKEAWETSFWGDRSVALTDLLLYLDYSEDICRCLPEYTIETEFGKTFGVNLTEGYARYEDTQVNLTAEQLEEIREILDWAEQDRE